jgi:hypothetical protein
MCFDNSFQLSFTLPYEHVRETDSADLEIHEVITYASLTMKMLHITERIISRKYNIHVKFEI